MQSLKCQDCGDKFRCDSLQGGICEWCRSERHRLHDLRGDSRYAVRHPDPEVMAAAVEEQRRRIEAEMGVAMLAGR